MAEVNVNRTKIFESPDHSSNNSSRASPEPGVAPRMLNWVLQHQVCNKFPHQFLSMLGFFFSFA